MIATEWRRMGRVAAAVLGISGALFSVSAQTVKQGNAAPAGTEPPVPLIGQVVVDIPKVHSLSWTNRGEVSVHRVTGTAGKREVEVAPVATGTVTYAQDNMTRFEGALNVKVPADLAGTMVLLRATLQATVKGNDSGTHIQDSRPFTLPKLSSNRQFKVGRVAMKLDETDEKLPAPVVKP